jgi:hypothetical protein
VGEAITLRQPVGPSRGARSTQRGDVGDLDVREPESPLGVVLDDAGLDRAAGRERDVRSVSRVDGLRLPAEQPGKDGACAGQVPGSKLQVDDTVSGWGSHALFRRTAGELETQRSGRDEFARLRESVYVKR